MVVLTCEPSTQTKAGGLFKEVSSRLNYVPQPDIVSKVQVQQNQFLQGYGLRNAQRVSNSFLLFTSAMTHHEMWTRIQNKNQKAPSLVSQTVLKTCKGGEPTSHLMCFQVLIIQITVHIETKLRGSLLSAVEGGMVNSHIYLLIVCSRLKQFAKRFWGANSAFSC